MSTQTQNAYFARKYTSYWHRNDAGEVIHEEKAAYKIMQYEGVGTNFWNEGKPVIGTWTEEEANAAISRVETGEEDGINFAAYSND